MTLSMNLMYPVRPQKAPVQTETPVLDQPRSDEALVQACLKGDEMAWHELVDKYGRLVYYITHRYNLESAEADDVFQIVFLIVLQRLGSLRKSESFVSWLMTIATRETQRVSKTKHRFVELDDTMMDVSEPPLDQIHREYLAQQVHGALAQLDGFSREFITALMQDPPPTYQTLATQFGMALGSIGPTRDRCLRKLETILTQMGVELV